MFFRDIGSRQIGEMRGVTWRAVPAEFKTGMCEMKSWGLRFCVFSWDIGSGQICVNARCNLESCSGRVQNRDVRDEILGSEVLCFFLGHWFRTDLRKCAV